LVKIETYYCSAYALLQIPCPDEQYVVISLLIMAVFLG
jgi:hypothetical protein